MDQGQPFHGYVKTETNLKLSGAHKKKPNKGIRIKEKKSKDTDIKEALCKWFFIVTSRGVSVSGPMLKSRSEEFAKKFGHINFEATENGYIGGKPDLA